MVSLLERDGGTVGFVARLAEHGGRIALATAAETVSYEDLAGRVDRWASGLGGARRLALVAGANEIDVVVAYLGTLRAGHVPLLVPGSDPALRDRFVATFDPDVVVGIDGFPVQRRVGTAHELHPDLCLLLSTSGSTGSPRLARLSRENLEANAEAVATSLGVDEHDRAATALPLHYCYGLSVLHSHLVRGAALVLSDLSVTDPCFWDLFRTHGCTSFAGVPHTFDLLDRVGFSSMSLPTLRYVTQAGGRLAPEVVQRYAELGQREGWDLVVMYGQTEATARMAYLPPELAAAHPHAVGVPVPGGSIRLEPSIEGRPDEGEVVFSGPNVMLGYADGPADLALGRTVHELRTGDLGRWDPTGLLEIVGRTSRFAKVAGLRIDLDEVEHRMRSEGFDVMCASDDRRLVVGVARRTVAPRHVADRAAHAAGIPAHRVDVVAVDALPRLANGKPNPSALLTAASPAEVRPLAEPAGVHPAVWGAFAPVLRVSSAAPDDTFVSLGGDSLSYVEVSIGLEEVLGELPANWHVTPLRDLVPGPRTRWLGRVETSVVLRAAAIVLIVGNHLHLYHLVGGAHLLLGLAGWNYARFNEGTRDRVRSIARIALPTMAWLTVAGLTVTPRIHIDHVLLVHSWVGHDGHGGYWYVETIVEILVGLAALLALPPVARLARAHPFGFPLALAAAGLVVRFGLVELPTPEPRNIRPYDIGWLFALGWAGAAAPSARARALVSALLLVAIPGYFGNPQRELVVAAGMLLLVWISTVPLPRLLVRPVGQVAAASFAIYLTHFQVYPPVYDRWGPEVAWVVAIAAGVGAWWACRRVGLLVAWLRRPQVERSGGYVTATAPE